jgi:DNA repair protein RadC
VPYNQLQVSVRYKRARRPQPNPTLYDDYKAAQVIRKICNKHQVLWIEEVLLLCLNSSNTLTSWARISTGGIDDSIIDLRVVATTAALSGAPRFILAHNHPSGSLVPSNEDIEITRRICEMFRFMQFHLEDHIIFTDKTHLSMKEQGLL